MRKHGSEGFNPDLFIENLRQKEMERGKKDTSVSETKEMEVLEDIRSYIRNCVSGRERDTIKGLSDIYKRNKNIKDIIQVEIIAAIAVINEKLGKDSTLGLKEEIFLSKRLSALREVYKKVKEFGKQ